MNRTNHARLNYPSIATAVGVIDHAVVWAKSPNPLSVWSASLSGQRDGFAVELRACGASEESALKRLDDLLDTIAIEATEYPVERDLESAREHDANDPRFQ